MMKALMAASLLWMADVAAADALDRQKLLELLPCKSAAIRLCDRSEGITAATLWRCGATLAERAHEVSQGCAAVLRRYNRL